MIFRSHKHALLSLFVAASMGGVMIADADAQSARSRSAKSASQEKVEILFPAATRVEPGVKASSKLASRMNKVFKAYNEQDFEQTRALADDVLAQDNANAYDKSVAAQLAAQAAYNLDDVEAAKDYLKQAVTFNGLDNNNHFQSLLMLSQLQIQDNDQDPEGLANMELFFAETNSTRPEDLIFKGQVLYQSERFAEAIPVLEQAIAASTEPKDNWYQVLMAAYANTEQTGKAIELAKQIAAKNPTDKRAQMNLASMYMQGEQFEQAAAVIEALRAAGQLTDEREYRQLYSIYANMDNQEPKVIEVINEGLGKGVLKEDYQTFLALAQSYYFSDKVDEAIKAWQKAAPLSPNGETYLNLARVLHGEGRIPEAREAARQAKAKGGLRKPEDAQKIINLK